MTDLDVHLPAIIAGDHGAFASWLAGAEPRVRASLASFARRVDTEALLQECLLRVWQVASRFEPDGRPDGLIRLAVRIARNLAITELRRRHVSTVEVERLERAAIATEAPPGEPDSHLRETIQRCRELLPEKPRRALDARLDWSGQPDRDLAKQVGMKLNTFLQNVRRARLHLAECLKRHGITIGGEA